MFYFWAFPCGLFVWVSPPSFFLEFFDLCNVNFQFVGCEMNGFDQSIMDVTWFPNSSHTLIRFSVKMILGVWQNFSKFPSTSCDKYTPRRTHFGKKNLFSIQSVTILGHQKNTSDWNSEQKPKQVSYLYTFIAIFLESNMPDVSKKIIHSNLKSTCSEWRAAKTSKEIPQNVNPNIWAERPTGFQNYTRKIQLCNILGKILPNLQKPFQDTKEGKK